jgi:hypothetical protein
MSLLPLADDLRLELEARTAEERNASAKAAPITHLARRSLRPAGHGGGARRRRGVRRPAPAALDAGGCGMSARRWLRGLLERSADRIDPPPSRCRVCNWPLDLPTNRHVPASECTVFPAGATGCVDPWQHHTPEAA